MWDEQARGHWYDGGTGMMDGGAFGWVMLFLMVLLVVAVLGAVVFALRRLPASQVPSAPGVPATTARAREILDERFARGEIDQEEYATRRSALE